MTDERIQNSQKDEPLLNKYTSQIVPSYYFIITKQKKTGACLTACHPSESLFYVYFIVITLKGNTSLFRGTKKVSGKGYSSKMPPSYSIPPLPSAIPGPSGPS